MHSQLGAKSKGQEEAKSVFPSTIKTIPLFPHPLPTKVVPNF